MPGLATWTPSRCAAGMSAPGTRAASPGGGGAAARPSGAGGAAASAASAPSATARAWRRRLWAWAGGGGEWRCSDTRPRGCPPCGAGSCARAASSPAPPLLTLAHVWQAAEEVPAAEAERKGPALGQGQGSVLVQVLQHRLLRGGAQAPLPALRPCLLRALLL